MVARRCHSSHDRRENGVESLINFSQPVRSAYDCTVDTDGCKRYTGCASNEVAKHDEVQPSNERVNELINADGSSISEQGARFAKSRYNFPLWGNMSKQR